MTGFNCKGLRRPITIPDGVERPFRLTEYGFRLHEAPSARTSRCSTAYGHFEVVDLNVQNRSTADNSCSVGRNTVLDKGPNLVLST